jgi:membrane-associated phospholipid phosphatase
MSVFDFPSRQAWTLLVVGGVLAYGALIAMGVNILAAPALIPLTTAVTCLGLSFFYTHARPDKRLAVTTAGTAFVLIFASTVGVLPYPAAAIGRPLRDDLFIGLERALGIDWPSIAAQMTALPPLNLFWGLVYLSTLPQIAVVVLVLGFAGCHERLSTYLSLLVATLLCTILLFVLAPTLGPIPSYGIGGDLYARLGGGGKTFQLDLLALRNGTFTNFDLTKLEGVISFPSFHCELAILTAWALAPVRLIGIPAVILNGFVVASTVPEGGHYFADILAGSLIAIAAISLWPRAVSASRFVTALAEPA